MNERRAIGFHYDAPTDIVRVVVSEAPGTVRTRTVEAALLLDDAGFLVGVDVEPDTAARTVVLLGAHEDVSRNVPARVGVCTDQSRAVFEIRIAGAGATVRGREKNPYV